MAHLTSLDNTGICKSYYTRHRCILANMMETTTLSIYIYCKYL